MTTNEKGIDQRGTDRLLADLARADAVRDTVEISDAARAKCKPSRIVAAMNEIYAKCPEVRGIEISPSITMDTRSGKVQIELWRVCLWCGPNGTDLDGDGQDRSLAEAIKEAVSEYNEKHGPTPRHPAEIEADNAAALEEVERFGDDGPCCGGGSQCRCGEDR